MAGVAIESVMAEMAISVSERKSSASKIMAQRQKMANGYQ
jgi:hypothetical protein